MNFQIKKILIPLDFSKTSLKALDHAVFMARICKAEITLLHVAPNLIDNVEPSYFVPPVYQPEMEENLVQQSDKHLKDIADRIKKKGLGKVNIITTVGRAHADILSTAKKIKADIIIMGTHGVSGVREFFIGSNTMNVIIDATCPVLSIQKGNKNIGFRNILLPFRDRPHSREKVMYAIELASIYAATIHVLGVDTEFTKPHKKKIELEAAQIKSIAQKKGVTCNVKVFSEVYVADKVLEHAKDVNADLIVTMSSMDRMDITEYFTGPFAQQIVNHSTIPVLSIRPKFNPETIDLTFY
jgi:nucleotide-binding universal stress UspA family protein